MSWEDSDPIYRRCPCGKGRYAVVSRSDDWGRHEERWSMECTRCRIVYRLFAYHSNRKGINETHYGWVPKLVLRDLSRLERGARNEERKLSVYMRRKYRNQWRQHFVNKGKKATWTELTEAGNHYPSLPTFYAHIRHWGVQRLLDEYLTYRKVETVVRVLGLRDTQLMSMVQKVANLEQIAKNGESQIHEHMFS